MTSTVREIDGEIVNVAGSRYGLERVPDNVRAFDRNGEALVQVDVYVGDFEDLGEAAP